MPSSSVPLIPNAQSAIQIGGGPASVEWFNFWRGLADYIRDATEPFVTPEMFNAKGDDPGDATGTDDYLAFQRMVTYAVANNIKTIKLGHGKIYNIFKDAAAGTNYVLMAFSGYNGLKIETNGARFVTNVDFGSTNATINVLNLTDCTDVDFGTIDTDQPNYRTASETRGINAVTCQDGCRNITGYTRMNGGFNGFAVNRGGSYTSAKRARHINIWFDCENVGYPSSFQRNGDQVFIVGRARGCHRTYTAYNVRGHTVTLDIDGSAFVESIVPKCFAVNGDTLEDNTTSDINIHAVVRGLASGNHGADVHLQFQQLTASAATAAMRNIKIVLDVTLGAATWTGITVRFSKVTNAAVADATLRNYIVENVEISGTFSGYAAAGNVINLFDLGTWTGESVRSVILRNLSIQGTTAGAIAVNCANISRFLVLENIKTPLAISLTNYTTSLLNAAGVVSSTSNYPPDAWP